jgi:ribulose-phosphate 3-epimerase
MNAIATTPVRLLPTPERAFQSKFVDRVFALAPSILAADFANLAAELRRMMRARCTWAHVDVMDGHFVPNITFGPQMVKAIRGVSPRLFIDTHLMIEDPLRFVGPFAEAGTNSITLHAEAVDSLPRALAAVRRAGVHVGVSVRPRTPLRLIEDALGQVDLVLVMTVEPGFGGQDLLPSTLSKVRQLATRREREKLKFLIQVDGGVNLKTAGLAVAAGANVLVAGTAIFRGGSIADNVARLTQAALKMGG